MTQNEYQELVEFLAGQYDRVWARFDQQREETRSLVLVTAESLRDEIRTVAEVVTTNRRHIGENGRRIEENGRRIHTAQTPRPEQPSDREGVQDPTP